MDKKIVQAANNFRKQLKNKPELKNIISLIEKKGFRVVFFNTDKGDIIVKAYKLEQQAKISRAFTYVSGNDRIMFIDNNVGTIEKLRAGLHEAGHIELGHFACKNTLDKQLMEAEAYSFMLEVLNPQKWYASGIFAILTVVVCLIGSYAIHGILGHQSKTAECVETQSNFSLGADYVYITRTGKKYHTQNCNYTKDKDCARIEREQADILFFPCDGCNP